MRKNPDDRRSDELARRIERKAAEGDKFALQQLMRLKERAGRLEDITLAEVCAHDPPAIREFMAGLPDELWGQFWRTNLKRPLPPYPAMTHDQIVLALRNRQPPGWAERYQEAITEEARRRHEETPRLHGETFMVLREFREQVELDFERDVSEFLASPNQGLTPSLILTRPRASLAWAVARAIAESRA